MIEMKSALIAVAALVISCSASAQSVASEQADPQPTLEPVIVARDTTVSDVAPPEDSQPSPALIAAEDPLSEVDSSPATTPRTAAERVVDWVIASSDNGDLPFAVIDKDKAILLVFDPSGQAVGQAPVLVGITKGDDSTPGVGDRELSNIPVEERTTPAGRFLAFFGPAVGYKEVLWVDLTDAISLHPVITSNPKERRLARLQSSTPTDNRITFGCINVPTKFYHQTIEPLFHPEGGVIYILPETRPLPTVFAGLPPDSADQLATFDQVFAGYRLETAEAQSIAAAAP